MSRIRRGILEYYKRTRGVGHTAEMLAGTTPGTIVIVPSEQFAKELRIAYPHLDIRGPQSPETLMGQHCPLLVDHHEVEVLLEEAERAEEAMQEIIGRQHRMIREIVIATCGPSGPVQFQAEHPWAKAAYKIWNEWVRVEEDAQASQIDGTSPSETFMDYQDFKDRNKWE